MLEKEIIKGSDENSVRTYNTIIDGLCQYCRSDFIFNPNNNKSGILGATEGNWVVRKDKDKRNRKYAVCPHCGHHNETDIFV